MVALSFQNSGRVKDRQERRSYLLKYEVLIQHLGRKHSTSISATLLPHRFDLEFPASVQDHMSGGDFFSCEMRIRELSS